MKRLLFLVSSIFFNMILFSKNFAPHKQEEKPIVIVIPSYNNANVVKKNLDSVFDQNYRNYRVVYIDDVSSDGTGDLVEKYIIENNISEEKIKLIRNKNRSLAMANLYRAIMQCDDNEIIATLDGDDWFSHNNVLSRLNELYQDENVWLTYGSYTDWPEPEPEVLAHWTQNLGGTLGNRPVSQSVIDNNSFRSFIGCTGQLRTFYAWLFKQVKLEDFMYKSQFLPMTYDVGIMIPMHELAGGRFAYVDEIIYIHNLDTELNDHKVDPKLQGDLEIAIRAKQPYQPLESCQAGYFEQFRESTADLVVFSFDRPLQLYAFLESLKTYVTGLNSVTVVSRASNEEFEAAYKKISETFASVTFLQQDNTKNRKDFKPLTLQAIQTGDADHIIFAVDDIIMTDEVNLSECIYWLESTDAHGFYLRLGTHLNYCYSNGSPQAVPSYATLDVERAIIAWQFEYGEHDWHYPNNVDMTLYRKQEVFSLFETLDFVSPNFLEGFWAQRWPQRTVGLCYEHAKMVNLPLNVVTQDAFNNQTGTYSAENFLELFKQGLKIDIQPLYQYINLSAHMDYAPIFISR